MYNRILVPVDGSPTSDRGLAEAIKLAKLTGARLLLLHAVDLAAVTVSAEAGAAAVSIYEAMREGGEEIIARARDTVAKAGITAETVLSDTLTGRLCDLVVDHATKWQADLVVIGTHGRKGVGRLLLGSDAEQIVRTAPVPVLLVRTSDRSKQAG